MKTATLILSLFMLLKPVLPVLEYVVLYDYIKNELCVNKDKPELECNGKCHLKKEMAKTAATDSSEDKRHSFSVETSVVFYQNLSVLDFLIPTEIIELQKNLENNQDQYQFTFLTHIFKPPIFHF
ncbi:hypothetical protein NPX36_00280 [Paenimyroides aestuarii]|uniref:Uncharacterized protein n=2 Tax=Paenimyroides aestuarii TaxID=2968490 RepID=A0ABY5NSJ4_9FLAO|nr:hypothetical protein [Paenimyroides aestuarii]UUV21531.1 hypothetical protein NPX36_00280 [Paenimyroides aestuarii]